MGATALAEGIALATNHRKIRSSKQIKTVWRNEMAPGDFARANGGTVRFRVLRGSGRLLDGNF
jgi:hypothetical protein